MKTVRGLTVFWRDDYAATDLSIQFPPLTASRKLVGQKNARRNKLVNRIAPLLSKEVEYNLRGRLHANPIRAGAVLDDKEE